MGLRHMLVDLVAREDLNASPAEMDTTATFDVVAAFGLLYEDLAARTALVVLLSDERVVQFVVLPPDVPSNLFACHALMRDFPASSADSRET